MNPVFDAAYMTRRLAATRRAQEQLTPSMQFDLARSDLTDDELEEAVGAFGAGTQQTGWGFSEVMSELLSREPKSIPAGDLKQLQQNLVEQGYMAQDLEPTGTWGPEWYAGFRRWDRDNAEQQLRGQHWLAQPVDAAIRNITYTLPSRVLTGIIGAAKGFVQQAPETAERAGLLGGAAGGAAIGAGLGSVLPGPGTAAGAVVGSVIGGAVGFLSDLFGSDEGEEDQTLLEKFKDALTPFEEYASQGPRAFFEDLGWVLTASSLTLGAGAAVKGVQAGVQTVRGIQAGAVAGAASGAGGPVPGFMQAALMKAPGGAPPGWFSRIVGAASRPVLGSNRVERLMDTVRQHGIMAQHTRPILKTVTGGYTGLSTAGFGARLGAGLGSGESRTTIEEAIAKTDEAVDNPVIRAFDDLASFILWPQAFFPWKVSSIGKAATRVMGNTDLWGYVHAMQSQYGVGLREAEGMAREFLGEGAEAGLRNTYLHLDHGLHNRVGQMLVEGKMWGVKAHANRSYESTRASIVRTMREEAKTQGYSSTARELIGFSRENPELFAAHLVELGGKGHGLERLTSWRQATRLMTRAQRELRDAAVEELADGSIWVRHPESVGIEERMGLPGGGEMIRTRDVDMPTQFTQDARLSFRKKAVEAEIERLEKKTKGLERFRNTRVRSEIEMLSVDGRLRVHKARLAELQSELDSLAKAPKQRKTLANVKLGLVRADTPTQRDMNALQTQYADLRQKVKAAHKANNLAAREDHWIQLNELFDDLTYREILPTELAEEARANAGDPGKAVSEHLQKRALGAPKDIDLPEQYATELEDLGFRAVATGEDIIFPDEMARLAETYDPGKYGRFAALTETLGLSPRWRSDRNLFALRSGHDVAELHHALEVEGIRMTGSQAQRRLYDKLKERNHPGVIEFGSTEKGTTLGPGILARDSSGKRSLRLYKIDVRELSPDDIYAAFDDVNGFTEETARKVFHALKRGAAYGGEVSLRHPVDSMRHIGRALRVNGLPGFTDNMRTLQSENPRALPADIAKSGTRVGYRPSSAHTNSFQRRRFEGELRQALLRTKVTDGERRAAMVMLDSIADAAVARGRAKNVNDFYRNFRTEWAERFEGVPAGMLLKRVADPAPLEDLVDLARVHMPETGFWYEEGADSLASIFSHTTTTLRNGREVDDFELMTNLLAVTSWSATSELNLEHALNALHLYKTRGDISPLVEGGEGIKKLRGGGAQREVIEQILDGHTIDQWMARGGVAEIVGSKKEGWRIVHPAIDIESPVFRTKAEAQKAQKDMLSTEAGPVYEEFGARLKSINFYANINQRKAEWANRVTNDRRIKVLFGFDPNHGLNATEYNQITDSITEVATQLGVHPMQAQASLWGGLREWLRVQIPRLKRTGQPADNLLAADYEKLLDAARDNASFGSLLEQPRFKQRIQELQEVGVLSPAFLTQQVQDVVRGSTQFGGDFASMIRFYRTADFGTLIHEAGHVLRRVLGDDELADISAFYGRYTPAQTVYDTALERGRQVAARLAGGERRPMAHLEANRAEVTRNLHNRVKEEWGGATYDPRTGEEVPLGSKAFAVALYQGDDVAMTIAEAQDASVFKAKLDEFTSTHQEALEREGHYVGLFRDEDRGIVSLDVSVITRNRDDAQALATFNKQKGGAFDFEAQDTIPALEPPEGSGIDGRQWTREAEEKFADDVEAYVKTKAVAADRLRQPMKGISGFLGAQWARMRGFAAVDTPLVDRGTQKLLDGYFGDALDDAMRKTLPKRHIIPKPLAGAALGAGMGAVEGDEGFADIARGAGLGTLAGFGVRRLGKISYGHMPDYLTRLNAALRYTLSVAFDAGRYSEQNMIAMAKYGLPGMLRPKKYINSHGPLKSPFAARGTVEGDEAWEHAVRLFDEVNGTTWFANIDDMDRRLYQAGMLGFSPRNFEVAQTMLLYQRGWGKEEIREAVAKISRYGLGRTAAEKSANFVFFPFSFSKKLIQSAGDFILQAPGRNLLVTEGLRRFEESKWDDKIATFIEEKAPLLQELARLNNFSYGISPGRFFLDGLDDNRTGFGKAAQVLASIFVPSGAATPLALAAGGLGDYTIHAFVPVVMTGETMDRMGGIDGVDDVIRRYVPFVREMDRYFGGGDSVLVEQTRAFTEGKTQWSQFTEYTDGVRAAKEQLEPFALAMGYASVDGLLGSDLGGIFSSQLEESRMDLAEKFPTGFRMAQDFTNQENIDAKALVDLSSQPDRSAAEDAILELIETKERWILLAGYAGLTQEQALSLASSNIRREAGRFVNDRRFAELYQRFLEKEFGPIRRVA